LYSLVNPVLGGASGSIEYTVPRVEASPLEVVPPSLAVPYNRPSLPSSSVPIGLLPSAAVKSCSVVRTDPSGVIE